MFMSCICHVLVKCGIYVSVMTCMCQVWHVVSDEACICRVDHVFITPCQTCKCHNRHIPYMICVLCNIRHTQDITMKNPTQIGLMHIIPTLLCHIRHLHGIPNVYICIFFPIQQFGGSSLVDQRTSGSLCLIFQNSWRHYCISE